MSMRSEEDIEAVHMTATRIEELAEPGSGTEAYAAGVGDVLAWLRGDVSPRVFRGFSEELDALTRAAEGDDVATIMALDALEDCDCCDAEDDDESEWVPLEEVTDDFYELMIIVDQAAPITDGPLTMADVQHLAQILGYVWAADVRGEPLGAPEVLIGPSESILGFTVDADSTKSRSDDIGVAVDRFLGSLPEAVANGSPVRTTNRAGAGTKGTRLVEPFGKDVTLRVLAR